MLEIEKSIEKLRKNTAVLEKKYINRTHKYLGNSVISSLYFPNEKANILLGDDTAALPQPDGSHLLLAAEGIVTYFLENDPWFAGYSAVMVNISDICAMGGLPIAVTDTLYVENEVKSDEIWKGMMAASKAYGVPIVGGHTCYNSQNKALSVSILGKATDKLLTSFNAKPNDTLLLVLDQNGEYYKEYSFWNASTSSNSERLQKLVKLPYEIANKSLSSTAKDVSMGGIIGTLLMLLNTSKVGAEINLESITKPKNIAWEKWLSSFPSYGYIFACDTNNIAKIKELFKEHKIDCDVIGKITANESELWINYKNEKIKF